MERERAIRVLEEAKKMLPEKQGGQDNGLISAVDDAIKLLKDQADREKYEELERKIRDFLSG